MGCWDSISIEHFQQIEAVQLMTTKLKHWGRDKMDAILSKRYFQTHFVNGFYFILINISLKFVPKGRIDNNPALV